LVLNDAWYFRKRLPLNWASEPPLLKNVEAVPSGPTKLNGPETLLLAAIWNWTEVPAGVSAFHDSMLQPAVEPSAGLASFSEETRLPDAAKPVCIKTLKPASVVTPPVVGIDQTVPLVAPDTLEPPG